jgi:hypothetical protein
MEKAWDPAKLDQYAHSSRFTLNFRYSASILNCNSNFACPEPYSWNMRPYRFIWSKSTQIALTAYQEHCDR